jgi:CPA1 family monovalent cation:H+ antiporter
MKREAPTVAQGLVVSWCGMRGLVTLATALALPVSFPARDLIVLSALAVVLGTLIFQGLTLGPLIRLLKFAEDKSMEEEMSAARVALFDAALEHMREQPGDEVATLREIYLSKRALAAGGQDPHDIAGMQLRLRAIEIQRARLHELRYTDTIDDDIFHELERELDLAELAVTPRVHLKLVES